MTFQEYQDIIKNYHNYPVGLGVYYASLALNEEMGNLSGKLKLSLLDDYEITDRERQKLGITLGDIIFWCSSMCSDMGLSLEQVMDLNLRKLNMMKEKAINSQLENNLNLNSKQAK